MSKSISKTRKIYILEKQCIKARAQSSAVQPHSTVPCVLSGLWLPHPKAGTRSWAKPHQSDHRTTGNHFSTVGDFSWCLWSRAGNSKNRCWEKLASKCAMWGTANPWGCKEVWCTPTVVLRRGRAVGLRNTASLQHWATSSLLKHVLKEQSWDPVSCTVLLEARAEANCLSGVWPKCW